jgi:N-acetylglucosaminyldiphosphoundecaprenol N-acetyl-beta-D-mannosaminyltransferase
MKKTDLTTNLFGLKIYSRDKNRLLENLISHFEKGNKTLSIFTPNSEQVVLSKKSKGFAKYLGFADILIPDGIGLIFATRIFSFFGKVKKGNGISERITGIDLTRDLLKIAKKTGLKVLIVGGRGYEGRKIDGQKVRIFGIDSEGNVENNDQNTIWWTEGYNKVDSPTDGESRAIISTISTLRPDLVFVAFGAPNQEKWIVENRVALEKSGVSVAMAVGGTFDMLLGMIDRAPKWMQNLGLEWFYRLLKEPWRWRRQLRLLEFVGMVVREIFS